MATRNRPSIVTLATAAAVLLSIAIAIWLWPRGTTALRREPGKAVEKEEASGPIYAYTDQKPEEPVKEEEEHAPATDVRPLIESVELEKKRACPGESVRVTVQKLRDVKNPVQYSIPAFGATGSPAIISSDDPGQQKVHVVASDGAGGVDYKTVELEILSPDAPECVAMPAIFVTAKVSGDEDDAADIRVVGSKNLGETLRYSYEFGDGTTLESHEARATHSYGMRDQNEPTSTFLVKVRAKDEKGRTATARASVAFRNVHWLATTVGSPMMPTSYNRFPEKRGSSYETEVTFKNIEKTPIAFSNATVTVDTCTGEEPTTQTYPAERVLNGMSGFAPGQSQKTTLSLPEGDVAGACRVVVTLEGDTQPPRAGQPIGPGMPRTFDTTRAQIALEIAGPPLKGAAAAAAPVAVADDQVAAQLEQAESILGKDHPVSLEDLRRLQHEGRIGSRR